MNISLITIVLSVVLGLIALVWSDALRRVEHTEKDKVDARLCNEKHRVIDHRLDGIREDLGRIFGSIESVRIELARINGGTKHDTNSN